MFTSGATRSLQRPPEDRSASVWDSCTPPRPRPPQGNRWAGAAVAGRGGAGERPRDQEDTNPNRVLPQAGLGTGICRTGTGHLGIKEQDEASIATSQGSAW